MSILAISPTAVLQSEIRTGRIFAYDFMKGALVMIMVLYHWLNYFVGPQSDIYRYLRFLTPSFIFITGFLISHISLRRSDPAKYPALSRRLTVRGLKILALFTILNLAIVLLVPDGRKGIGTLGEYTAANLVAIFITGKVLVAGVGKAASFFILVPIGYLLILCGIFAPVARRQPYVFHAACGLVFSLILLLWHNDVESPNLELLALGLLGVACGYLDAERLNRMIASPLVLLAAYAGYMAAIERWNAIFILQTVGVPLTLLMLYYLAVKSGEHNGLSQRMVLAGKYSLFAYIGQIGILQIIYRSMKKGGFELDQPGILVVSLFCGILATGAAVVAMDWGKRRYPIVDKLYGLVFS